MGQEVEIKNSSLSSQEFDTFFGDDLPESNQIKPEEIIGASKIEEGEKEKEEIEETPVNSKDFFEDDDEEEVEETKTEAKKSTKKEKTEEEPEEIEEELIEQPELDEDAEKTFYKAKVDHLIEKGAFFDFEGRDEFEYTEENYLQLVEKQAEWKAEEKFKDKVERLGDYKVLIDHLEEGGDPDEIIEIFKESKELNKIDTSTVRGKVEYLRHYYVEELGWTESKFERTAKLWANDEELLNEEFRDSKAEMDELIQKKIQEKREAQVQFNKQQEELRLNFENSINHAMKEDDELTAQERKEIRDALFKYDKSLPDGRMVNRFTQEFMKIQSNPKDYLDLIKKVLFKEKVEKVKAQKIETEVTKKIWGSIKNNATVRKNVSQKISRDTTPVKDLVVKW